MSRFRWSTAGESHGKALIGIIEGLPAGLELDEERVNRELKRRQAGYGRGGRMKIEQDQVEFLSGLRAGITLGSPVAYSVSNKDAVIERMPIPPNPRPGHADLAGCQKYGHQNPRDILERASARETATRVAGAGIARQVLEHFGIELFGHVLELGGEAVKPDAFEACGDDRFEVRAASDCLSLDPEADVRMRAAVDRAKSKGDTLGGIFEVRALGVPPGLGSCASGPERLTARIGAALFSIPAMKGVEFGLGFEVARVPGSEAHDAILPGGDIANGGRFRRETNRSGGLEGGMTTGEPVVCRVAMKPIPTLRQALPSVDFATGEPSEAAYQRSDVTSVPAASVVGEAMVALALTEAFLEKFGGDSMEELERAHQGYRDRLTRI